MDRNFDTKPLFKFCGKERLCDTLISEYLVFFKMAVEEDIKLISNKL